MPRRDEIWRDRIRAEWAASAEAEDPEIKRREFVEAMEEQMRAAGYARGHVVTRVMPGGESISITSSAGTERRTAWVPTGPSQHHLDLVQDIQRTQLRTGLARALAE